MTPWSIERRELFVRRAVVWSALCLILCTIVAIVFWRAVYVPSVRAAARRDYVSDAFNCTRLNSTQCFKSCNCGTCGNDMMVLCLPSLYYAPNTTTCNVSDWRGPASTCLQKEDARVFVFALLVLCGFTGGVAVIVFAVKRALKRLQRASEYERF